MHVSDKPMSLSYCSLLITAPARDTTYNSPVDIEQISTWEEASVSDGALLESSFGNLAHKLSVGVFLEV